MAKRRIMALTSLYTGLSLVVGALAPTLSAAASITPDLERAGWKVLALPGKVETQFIGRPDGVIEVRAENSVALLYREIPPDEGRNQYLSWRWRVDKTMPPTDLSQVGHDDRPLAVHIWFPPDPDGVNWWRRITDTAMTWIVGARLTGKVLTYVWGGIGRRGDCLAHPFAGQDGAMCILRSGDMPTGRWLTERIDVAGDFERAFGDPAPAPIYLAVSADADDTESSSTAMIADIMFGDR